METLNIVAFVASLLVFAGVAIAAGRGIGSPRDYFHNPSKTANTLSLTIANITVGSGIVYLISGAATNGPLMYAVPVTLFASYWLLAVYVDRVVPESLRESRNFLSGVSDAIETATGRRSSFGISVTCALVCVYVLFLAFEVYASAQLLSPMLFADAPGAAAWLSIGLFALALFYTVVAGIRGVFRTDKLQFSAVLLLLTILVFASFSGRSTSTTSPAAVTGLGALPAIAAACLATLATQFYSVLNWGTISHLPSSQRKSVLLPVGALTAALVAVAITAGLAVVGEPDPVGTVLARYFGLVSDSGLLATSLAVVMVVGIVSIVVSTMDSLMLTITMFWYDNVIGRNSQSGEDSAAELKRLRLITVGCFAAGFLPLLYLNDSRPSLFFTLLAIAGGVIVYAPLIAVAGIIARRPAALKVFTGAALLPYHALFLAAFAASIALLRKEPALTAWVGPAAFLLSAAWSAWLWSRARTLAHS